MLEVQNLRIRTFDLDAQDLYWETSGDDPLDYTFEVLRSDAEFGEYVPVSRPFSDRYHFRDSTVTALGFHRSWYYRLKVTHAQSGNATYAPPIGEPGVHQAADIDLEGLEMARQVQIQLEEFTGRQVWIFTRRTFGQRCSCWDVVNHAQTRSGCLSCFDTGFVGGYHSPIQTPMKIVVQQDTTTQSDASRQQVAMAQGELANYPTLVEGMLVVEAENIRWRVEPPIGGAEKLRSTVHQTCKLVRVTRDDVAYKLPIRLQSVKDLQASPERQFTLPQDPQNASWLPKTSEAWSSVLARASGAQGSPSSSAQPAPPEVLIITAKNGTTLSGLNQTLPAFAVVALLPATAGYANQSGVVLAGAAGSPTQNDPINRLSDVYGVVQGSLSPGATGSVARQGRTRVLKVPAEMWEAGDRIYLSTTPGLATKQIPLAGGTWIRFLGYAGQAATGTVGVLDLLLESKVQN